MIWTPEHSQLRQILVSLFDSKASARIVAIDAGLAVNRINWDGNMITAWHQLMEEAIKLDRLAELIAAAAAFYPNHSELQKAWTAVQNVDPAQASDASGDGAPQTGSGQTTIVHGDQYHIGNISGSSGIAIGRGAQASGGPGTTPGQTTPRAQTGGSGVNLVRQMTQAFSLAELAELCFALGIDFDNIPGATRNAKARETYLYLKRRGRVSALLEQLAAQRPDMSWQDD